ncbi:MAG: XRE family transcriptional regulator [Pseudomonadota bacterium]
MATNSPEDRKKRRVDIAGTREDQQKWVGTQPEDLGQHIRQLRTERGWKLSELSERTGMAISTISKVENGKLSLTYDRLLLTASAFGMSLSEFLSSSDSANQDAAARPASRIDWALADSGSRVDTPNYLYRYLCENIRVKKMIPIVSQVRARSVEEFGPLLSHPGEEFIFVTKGRIEVYTEYYAPRTLEVGEGVYLDSLMGHAFINAADEGEETWIVSVNVEHN